MGVIAPVVPAVFQVLLPLLLIAGSALILAIPRWFLVFSHWLWLRVAPKSLINRSMPGVQARIFQGVAIKGFEDEYVLSMPDEGQDFRARVVAFLKNTVREFEMMETDYRFTGGAGSVRICLGISFPAARKISFRISVSNSISGGEMRWMCASDTTSTRFICCGFLLPDCRMKFGRCTGG